MTTEFDEYAAIEQWVKNNLPAEVRQGLTRAEGSEKKRHRNGDYDFHRHR